MINYQLPIARFLCDEAGQGIIFAAATLLLLVGFVALVYNIGRVVERRTKMQLGADSAAYAGATVEGNSLSAIGWINSAMAQVYYNSLKYAVDVNVSGVAAELERRLNGGSPGATAYQAYKSAYTTAQTQLPQAKQWMVDLSRIENAIAILTPRLAQEEMFAVAEEVGAERVSVYPSFRMFPHADSLVSYSIRCLGNGWTITKITPPNNGNSLSVTLDGNTWVLQYTNDGIVTQEVDITQDSPTQWDFKYFSPPGKLLQEVEIENTNGLGWVVWGSTGNPPTPIPSISFQTVPALTPDGATVQATQLTQGGTTQVLWMGADGNLYTCAWNSAQNAWVVQLPALTSSQTQVGGVNVNVNVSNVISFPGGATVTVGNPPVVQIGRANIVLSNPPTITTGFDQVRISVNGFTMNSFNISVGGFSLNPGDSDGQWRKWYDPIEELWKRNRLVVTGVDANNQPNSWQYDYEVLGTLLMVEPTMNNPFPMQASQNTTNTPPNRFLGHAFGDRGYAATLPAWVLNLNASPATGWFDPTPFVAAPHNYTWTPVDSDFGPPDSNGIRHVLVLPPAYPPPGTYYQTAICTHCSGTGRDPVTGVVCPLCHAWQNDPARGDDLSDVRVTIADLNPGPQANPASIALTVDPTLATKQFPADFFLNAPMFLDMNGPPSTSSVYPDPNNTARQLPPAGYPLVLSEDYFKYGINVGVWKSPVNPLLFPTPGQTQNAPAQNIPAQYSQMISPTSLGMPNQPQPSAALSPAPQNGELWPTPQWWGSVAVASARVGIKNDPAEPSYVYNFDMTNYGSDDPTSPRAVWCSSSPWNLYLADVNVKLLPSKELQHDEANSQIQQCDLDEDVLQATPVTGFYNPGTATSYLWGAILTASQSGHFESSDWLSSFNGRADPRVGNALRNMQDRRGNAVNFGSPGMDNVVQH